MAADSSPDPSRYDPAGRSTLDDPNRPVISCLVTEGPSGYGQMSQGIIAPANALIQNILNKCDMFELYTI